MRAHTFVVRGDLAKIHSDLYVLPTDAFGSISGHWADFLAGHGLERSSARALARDLVELGYAALASNIVAFNSGGGTSVDPADVFLARFDALLNHLDSVTGEFLALNPELGRPPRIAMPLLGIGRAGHRPEVGLILKELLRRIERRSDSAYDVVLVAFHEADYSAVQYLRQLTNSAPDLSLEMLASAVRLATHARNGTLAVMFGAGASAELGLPSWKQLLQRLGSALKMDEAVVGQLNDLDAIDAASLLVDASDNVEAFNRALEKMVETKQSSLMHALLANLHPSIAITTNYDAGYEIAIESISQESAAVMPWDRPINRSQPRVLKLHGDASRGSIVLSRDQFVSMQAYRKPLIGTLQERMLVGHVLVVGSSMSDSTMVHAAEEVAALALAIGAKDVGNAGTVILTRSNPARELLLSRVFTVQVAEPGPDASVQTASRQILIFLDYIGLLASDVSTFLMDARYDNLLEGAELKAAKFGRELTAHTKRFVEDNPHLIHTKAMQHLDLFVRPENL